MPKQPEPPSVVAIATFVEEALDRETALAEAAASVTSIPDTDTDKDADRASGKEFWLVA
jgi:alkylhydroperoxidase family enzyme